MIRVLGLSSIAVDQAASAGAERIAQLYRFLSKEVEVDLVSLTGAREGKKKGTLQGGTRFENYPSFPQSVFFYLQKLKMAPFFEVSRFHRAFPSAPARRLDGELDVVQFDSLWLTPWIDRVPQGKPVIYSSQNYETDWYQGEIRGYPLRRIHARTLSMVERRAVERADMTIAVTEEDKECFERNFGIPGERIEVIPNGYDDTTIFPVNEEAKRAARRQLGLPEDGRIALFVGSGVAPNQDAVESILHVISRKAPEEVIFVIAGSVGDAFPGAGNERCVITGRVPEIEPYFQAADVGLNPIRLGSGSNIKLLQYLGSGLPVVTTEFGMRGFEDLIPFVSMKRIDLFHRHLSDLTLDPKAVDTVRERYAWRNGSIKLEEIYRRLTGN